MLLTIRQIAERINIPYNSVYTFLGSYKFDKFRTKIKSEKRYKVTGYNCTKDFWNEFLDYLDLKNRQKMITNVKNYLDLEDKKEYNKDNKGK